MHWYDSGADKILDRAGPFVLGCQDKTFLLDDEKPYFPEVPFIAHYVVDHALARRYAGAWRFSPSDMYGNPRPFGVPVISNKTKAKPTPFNIALVALVCSFLVAALAFYAGNEHKAED